MGTIRLSTSTTSPHLLTRPTNKSKKKYQFCILYLKEEVPIMYLLSLWFYWPDPPTRQRRSINFVFYISLILLPRPTHKSRKRKIRICRICGHASFRYIYICLFHDDSFGFNIWHYLHHLLVHLFVSNGRTLSGSPLGDNLSRAKAALMLTMSIRLYPIHYLLRHFTYILFRF